MIVRLRAAAYAVWFYGMTVAFGLAGVLVRRVAAHRSLNLSQAWARAALAGLRPLLGARLVLSGTEHLPTSGPALLACQHQSEYDTLVWMTLLPFPAYVTKLELVSVPLVGPMLVPAGMIPVDRTAGAAALRKLLTDTKAAAAAGRQIVIFPEGTRLPPGQRSKLQPGVAAVSAYTGLPVLPVATDSGVCWQRRVLARRGGTIHVSIGSPIPAETGRAEMLDRIEAFWRLMEDSAFGAVDNIVDDASAPPRAGAARHR